MPRPRCSILPFADPRTLAACLRLNVGYTLWAIPILRMLRALPRHDAKQLELWISTASNEARWQTAQDPSTPPYVLARLLLLPANMDVIEAVAANPATPVAALTALTGYMGYYGLGATARMAVFAHPALPRKALLRLVQDANDKADLPALLHRQDLPRKAWFELAESWPHATADILEQATAPVWMLRRIVAAPVKQVLGIWLSAIAANEAAPASLRRRAKACAPHRWGTS